MSYDIAKTKIGDFFALTWSIFADQVTFVLINLKPADWVFTRWTRLDNKWLLSRIKLLPWSQSYWSPLVEDGQFNEIYIIHRNV